MNLREAKYSEVVRCLLLSARGTARFSSMDESISVEFHIGPLDPRQLPAWARFDGLRRLIPAAVDLIERLEWERDEARRLYCEQCATVVRKSGSQNEFVVVVEEAHRLADELRWDCYGQKQEAKP